MITLRPYQEEARQAVEEQWASGNRKTLLTLVTGGGKTIIFSKIIEDRVRLGDKVLVLAHRGELLEQAADKLYRTTGLQCAVEKADQTCLGSRFPVTVGSVQTLQRPDRLARFPKDYFGTIVVDEAHHVMAAGYQRVLEHFDGAYVLGVTATPDRGDMKNLGQYFDTLAYDYPLRKAVKEGYLCKIMALMLPLRLDISNVSTVSGDYDAGALGHALDPYLDQIAQEMAEHCRDRKTVVFLPLINTAQKMRDALNQCGFRAAEINGASKDRAQILRDFDEGKYNVLCNAMLLTEGWDCPSVDCVVVLRPTKIRSLYQQMIGRGTRLFPNKDHLLLLDFLWNTQRHELCRPASLVCKSQEIAEQMTANLEFADEPLDIIEEDERAARDVIAEREEKLRRELEEMRRKKAKLVDPLQYEISIEDEDLADYEPTFGWEVELPTAKQLQTLEKFGILPDAIDSKGKASLLLDKLMNRRENGMTTPKQIRFLESRGFLHVGTWQFEEARMLINRIAGNRWRVPYDINPITFNPGK